MRGPGLLISLGILIAALPAFAQEATPENTRAACTDHRDNDGDGHVDCDDQDCEAFVFCASAITPRTNGSVDDVARLRGRGVTEVVVGSVLLSLGVVAGGVSSALWIAGTTHDGFNAYDQGGVALDTAGVVMIAAGTTFLALGAGKLAEARRSRVAFAPSSLAVRF